MSAVKQIPDTSISKVYSTLVGGVIATSIIVMGNGAVSVGHNYAYTEQKVCYYNEKPMFMHLFLQNLAYH